MKSLFQSPTKANSSAGSTLGIVVLLVSVLVTGWLLINRQYVLDQLTVWQYRPSSEVQAIASKAQMNDQGQFYFYASQPEVDEASVFNKQCKKQEEHSAILGCYSNRRIYIYNVPNAQLDGIKEVTAAHEMLHAAWDRLSDSKKQRLNELLTAAYNRGASDKLEERMDYYARTQPGERTNELHSIIGTEFTDLDDELEAYYAQYFTDRKQVVALHQRYEALFTQLDQKSTSLTAELDSLTTDIERESERYNTAVNQLNNDIQDFNTRAQSNSFASEQVFNERRAELVSRSSALDAQRSAINTKIARYEALRAELEAVNGQSQTLNRSLDSTLAPAPAI